MTAKSLWSTAYHEAGHAVAAYYRYFSFERVTILPDETSVGKVVLNMPRGFRNIEFEITPKRAAQIADKIVISFAGGIAQRKYNKRGYRKYHTSSDDQSAVDLAFRLNGSSEAANAYLHWLYIVARHLVDRRWREIRAVANKLMQSKTISRDDVDSAICSALGLQKFPARATAQHR